MLIAVAALAPVGLAARLAAPAQQSPEAPQLPEGPQGALTPQVIEVLADHDSRYKIAGEKDPVITVHAGQAVTLRITAKKAKNKNRDGSIHGFSLLRAGDRSRVPGWDFLLKPGIQEFNVMAPAEPGEYVVVCTVICSPDHEGMNMKFVVLPGQAVPD
jgi:heme/copper-type cytochrome/quinol oxidase subunit 2